MRHFVLYLGLALLLASPAQAETFKEFIAGLKIELTEKGLDATILDRAVTSTPTLDTSVTKKLKKQPESTFTFEQYRNRLVSKRRVLDGTQKIQEYKDLITSISSSYEIPYGVIAALWGVETSYGKLPGKFNIINSLATLAYKSHRRDFFRKELVNAVRIVHEGHISLDDLTGSWAGAMGQCQFMPSSFFSFAADGNNDGRKDIWQTEADVFASAANYLKKSGWRVGANWGQRVVLGEILPKIKISERGLTEPKPVSEWQDMGVFASQGGFDEPNNLNRTARLFMPDGPSGKVYMVYENFDVIMKWNRSSYFAFAVLTLADKLSMNTESRS